MRTRILRGKIKSLIERSLGPRVPTHISKNFIRLDASILAEVAESIRQNYFSESYVQERGFSTPDEYLTSEGGSKDLLDHLHGRLDGFRSTVVPWLDSVTALSGARILEIGCGPGSSTIALAEQGAKVTAVDIDEEALAVAKDKCRVYGQTVDFLKANAIDAHKLLSNRQFDFVIFFAALEHMTHTERMAAMRSTWEMLSPGGFWCIIDTPNRLWYFDDHTSLLPFYHWLPDEVAFLYSRFSPRQVFRQSYREYNSDSLLHFLRRGRGVSFHEFGLALKEPEKLDVVSSLPIYLRKKSIIRRIAWRLSFKHRYESLLIATGPRIHRGFYQQHLNLVIRKD